MHNDLLIKYLPKALTRKEFLSKTLNIIRPTDEQLNASPQERLTFLHASRLAYSSAGADSMERGLGVPHFPRPALYPVYVAVDAYMRSSYAVRAQEKFHNGQPVIGTWPGKPLVESYEDRLASVQIMPDEKAILLTGPSGGGKSVGLQMICSLFPAVIDHVQLSGGKIQLIQIPILQVRCIGRFSARDVAMSFINAVTRIVGPEYTRQFTKRQSVPYLFSGIAMLCNMFAIGIVVWDEFQDILEAKGTNSRSILNLILATISLSKTAMLFCGTYHTLNIFTDDVRASRRYSQADFRIHRVTDPNSKEWKMCCKVRWDYQFVMNRPKLTDALIAILYEYSQGLPAYLDTIIVNAQIEAIINGSEVVDANNLKQAWIKSAALHGPVAALTSGQVSALKQYRDLWHSELMADPIAMLDSAKRMAAANKHVIR